MSRRIVIVSMTLADSADLAELGPAATALGAEVACLQGRGPALAGVLDKVAAESEPGDVIRLVPVTRAEAGTARSWVRRVAGHWRRTRGRIDVEVTSDGARSFDPQAVAAVAAGSARPVTGREAGLESPAWEHVPPYRHHLLVCRGPRCNARGAQETVRALSDELSRLGLLDDEVLLAQTGCLYPCNGAPVVVAHPAGTWYRGVTAEEATRIVHEDLLDGSGAE